MADLLDNERELLMSPLALTYLIYAVVSVYITVVVGHKLHYYGRPFLVECFAGRTQLADAVNHLLLVGYYLLNCALAAFLLYSGFHPANLLEVGVLLSTKLGHVMLILGAMHFLNILTALWVRTRFRASINSGVARHS